MECRQEAEREEQRAQARQNRIADAITAFSGSMLFVYVHIIWFGCWIGFGVEKSQCYSAIVSPEPPNSSGKSLSLGRPSFMGRTVDS